MTFTQRQGVELILSGGCLMEYTVKGLADLAGVSTRTLRWYDQKGLLTPSRTNDSGYRLYDDNAVSKLQQIMFYRELEFSLAAIKQLLDSPDFDHEKALQSHLRELRKRRKRIDDLILTVKKTLKELSGGAQMSDQEKFESFKSNAIQKNEARYGKEIRENYGDESVDGSNAALMNLTQEQYNEWNKTGAEIQALLNQAVLARKEADSPEGQQISELHRHWCFYGAEQYDPQKHAGLAQLYICDSRFSAYYDREVNGCAKFLRDAILSYTSKL